MKKYSLTKKFSAGMIAASLGMLSTASLFSKQVHASSITPVVAQKSNQSISTAVDTISNKLGWIGNDDYLKKLGINVNNLDSQNFLSIASLFHIFANQASLTADTNGNLAVKILNKANDFGTRGKSPNLTSGDINYIQQLAQNLPGNAFRNTSFNHVILGKGIKVDKQANRVLINDTPISNLKPADVQSDVDKPFINFDQVFNKLKLNSSTASNHSTNSENVVVNFTDMNNRYVDVSNAKAENGYIYLNIPFQYLSAPQPLTIKGLSNSLVAPTIIVNVTDIPNDNQNISTQIQLKYEDGNILANSESHTKPNHIVWNFGNDKLTLNFNSGRFMGSILAPNATVNANVNIDGNIIADSVNISGDESHRWDLQPAQQTQSILLNYFKQF